MKYWEIIADNLKDRGWSLGWVSALDREGRTIWIVDAHRDQGKRFVGRADEKLTAFLELEQVTRESLRFLTAEWVWHNSSMTRLLSGEHEASSGLDPKITSLKTQLLSLNLVK
ncbi:MAG: hypothetical protein C5B58_13200 [Acidobacteria bacterium]|nr:MAG: hypothetical protein C5B58_13200 [Acidobacteriota bacterium]